MEACVSGLNGSPGKTVCRKAPGVRILSLPPIVNKNHMSKILVVFYSKTGNTERAAKDIAAALGADLEKIEDKKNRRGILAWFSAGRDASKKRQTQIETSGKNPADHDLVIVGSPVWAWNITPAMRTYLGDNKENIKKYAFFVTSGNTDSEKIAPHVREIMGRDPLAHVGFNAAELKDKEVYGKKMTAFIEAVKNV